MAEQVLECCRIDYRAPVDAVGADLPTASIDLHMSRSVLEHVRPGRLGPLLGNARRMLKPGGLAVQRIDHSGHFTNFLRFGEAEWGRCAGSRLAYVNRLRS